MEYDPIGQGSILIKHTEVRSDLEGQGLGSQLLASAAGAEVFRGKNGLEVGALPGRWTKEGLAGPVIAGVAARTVVAQWHQDTFKPVPGATLLASTDRYTQQAFRLGNSYGFQFHLELTASASGLAFASGTAIGSLFLGVAGSPFFATDTFGLQSRSERL